MSLVAKRSNIILPSARTHTPGKDTTSKWILNYLDRIPLHIAEIIKTVALYDQE
jgi:hypothetical protein